MLRETLLLLLVIIPIHNVALLSASSRPYCGEVQTNNLHLDTHASWNNHLKRIGDARKKYVESSATTATTGWADPYFDLAAYWAPVIYQDTDDSYYKGDYITRFDFDGDWVGNNNWENLDNYDQIWAYVYYAVVETETHYFIFYMFFHPRDWNDVPDFGLGEHENDMEGAMVVITKDGSRYGSFLLMETRAHLDFYQYTNDPNISSKNDTVDGGVIFQDGHPTVFIEAKGHGVYAWDGTDFPGGDGVVYYYINNQTDYPTSGNDRNVSYALIPIIRSLWPRRYDIGNGHMYDDPFVYSGARYSFQNAIGGAFDGDTNTDDAANPPWGMDDGDDGPVYRGDWFFDPAWTVYTHLSIPYTFSLNYTYNPYLIESGPEWTPPSITVYSPASDTYYNTSAVTFDFDVYDDYDLYSLVVTANGTEIYSSRNKGRHTFVHVFSSDGTYIINITAMDIWGNYRTMEFTIYIDTQKPNIWAMIENNSWVSSSEISFDWFAEDNFDIDKVVILLDGNTIATRYSSNGTETISFGDEGLHSITLEAYDLASNVNSTTYLIHVDFNPPTISIVSPQNETTTMNSSVTIRWSSEDSIYLAKHEVYLDGSLIATLDNTTKQFTISNIAEGEHRVRVVAYDYVGHSSYDEIVIYVDRTPPSVSIQSPQNDSLVPMEFVVEWTATDNMGLTKIEILLDNQLYAQPDVSSTNCTITIDEGGDHNITVIVYDIVGLHARSIVNVYCDAYPPVVDILVDNGTVFETDIVFIEWDVQEDRSISERYVIVNDYDPLPVYKDNVSLALSDGVYLITVRIYDEAGNVGEDSITIFVDTMPPDVEILSPSNHSYTSECEITISWDANDRCGITRTEIHVDDIIYIPQGSSINVTIENEGEYNITVIVWDYANNTAKSAVFITVDRSAPSIDILSPQNNSKHMDNITLTWSASDALSDVSLVRILINNTLYGEFSSSEGSRVVILEPGVYLIMVEAVDNAGNNASMRLRIYMAYLSIIYPDNNANISSSSIDLILNYTLISSVKLYINDTYVATFSVDQTYTVTFQEEGIWKLTVVDAEQPDIRSIVIIRVDWTSPLVNIGNVPEYTNTSTIRVSWSAQDSGSGVELYELYVNGTRYWRGKTRSVEITLDEGTWNITVFAIDYANNSGGSWRIVVVDMTSPTIDISIENGTVFDTVYVTISWVTTDNLSGVLNVSVFLNGVLQGTYNASDKVELMLENGRYRITLRTKDLAGNSGYATVVFSVSAPSVILIYGPDNNSYLANNTTSFSWKLFNGEIVEQRIYVDGEEILASNTSIVLRNLPDGRHNLTVIITDDRGEVRKATVIFYVDTTPPQLEILEPMNGTYINSTKVLVKISYSDNLGVDDIAVLLNGTPINVSLTDSFYLNLREGYNNITIKIYDLAGNYDEEHLEIIVDTTSPIVQILEPTNGTKTNNTQITIRWSVQDNTGIDRIEIQLNGTMIAVLYGNVEEYTIQINSTSIIKIVVYDLAGNCGWDQVVVIYTPKRNGSNSDSNSEISNSPRPPIRSAMGLLLILITMLGIAVVVRKKRRKNIVTETDVENEHGEFLLDLGETLEELDRLFEENL